MSLLAPVLVLVTVASVPPRPPSLEGFDPMVAARIEETWAAAAAEAAGAPAWLELGRVYHAHELTELARECYLEATRRAPDEAKAWYSLAHAEADLGLPEGALDRLERVVELAPGYAPAHWRRGRWLLELGREAEAEEAFRRSTRVDPSDIAGWVGLARVLLGRGEARPAIDILQRVLAADPANGVAGQLLGSALRAAGDEAAARRALALATGMGARFPDPWHDEILDAATGVGNILRRLSARLERGEVDPVIAELEALRRDHPRDVGVLNKLSEGYLLRGRPAAALEVLAVALEEDPGEFATLVHLAQAERLRGDLTAALAWANRAVEANPRFWQVHFTRAGILHREGRFRDCLAALDSAMRLGAHQNPNAWLMQGDARLRLAEWEAAAESFESAARRFPFLGQAFVGLAAARVEQGRTEEARRALEAARRLAPGDPSLASVAARIEEVENARPPTGGGEG